MMQTLFSGKQLILNEINATCTKSSGRSMVEIIARFPHMHILDALKDVNDLALDGKIALAGSEILKK